MIRLDDLTDGGGSWSFTRPVATGRADELAAVVPAIAAAERHAGAGEWVVLVVAYEAAAAFDPAMGTAPEPPPGVPFVWWQAFSGRRPAPPLAPPGAATTGVERRSNRLPYPAAVADVRDRIAAGDVYQVNVTDRFAGRWEGTPLGVYAALLGAQRCAFGAYVELDDVVVASASPELFFSWDAPTITCRPMKGTAARRPRPVDDEAAAAALRASTKDRAENVMIVDLLRNDLGRIADVGSVRVPALFSLERYDTVWQLTSTVTATLGPTVGLVDVLRALFPCGSVTGAPKIAAMREIARLEAEPRGVYCGAIGVLAPPGEGPRAVCSVPIRTAVLHPPTRTLEYGAGAGITWSSDPAAEDDEVRTKARILTARPRDRVVLLETLRLDEGGVRHAADHLDRMAASARWFGHRFERAAIAAHLAGLAPVTAPQRVRVTAAADGAWTVTVVPLDDLPRPVRLAIDDVVTTTEDVLWVHKTTTRDHHDAARARHPGADDVVLVNRLGHAVETTIANLAYRVGGRWYVPPLDDGGLAGVARQHAVADGRVGERSIAAGALARCEQLAVLNDLRGWRPAVLVGPAGTG